MQWPELNTVRIPSLPHQLTGTLLGDPTSRVKTSPVQLPPDNELAVEPAVEPTMTSQLDHPGHCLNFLQSTAHQWLFTRNGMDLVSAQMILVEGSLAAATLIHFTG